MNENIIDDICPASAKERKRLKRILKHFSIGDYQGLRVTYTEFMPVFFEGNLYLWSDLEMAEDVASLSHSSRSEKKVVKDEHGILWLSTLFDDSSYDCRVIRTYIKVDSIQDAEELCDVNGTFSSASNCRPPFFFRENLDYIKFVKPIPEHMTVREELEFTIDNTQIL